LGYANGFEENISNADEYHQRLLAQVRAVLAGLAEKEPQPAL